MVEGESKGERPPPLPPRLSGYPEVKLKLL